MLSKTKKRTESYKSPEGHHRHKCQDCGTVWEHSDRMAGNEAAHHCPSCKVELEGGWFRYEGPEAPDA